MPVRPVRQQQPQEQAPQREDLRERIARAAYYRAEKRGFEPGREHDDWLEAEQEIVGKPPR